MSSEAKAILLHEDIIIPSCGTKRAGEVVTREEAGCSFQWLFENQYGEAIDPDLPRSNPEPEQVNVATGETTIAEETDAESDESSDSEGEASGEKVAETESVAPEVDAEVVSIVRNVLTEGKLQLKTILSQTGLTEEAVTPVLTEANGFKRNQQGWYSNV